MAIAGYKATMQIGSTPVTMTNIQTADLQIDQDVYDISDLAGGVWKKKLGGMTGYTLKIGGNYDLTDAQMLSLQALILTTPGTVANWTILTGNSTHSYAGTLLLKNMNIKFDVKKQQEVTFDGEGTGAVTYT